jgi:predicted porin
MSPSFRRLCFLTGLCVAGGASAQSNVTLYGMLDVGLVHDSGLPDGHSVTKLSSGIFNGSRWGLRGREDLGGGLAAIFTAESGFQADTGAMGQGGLLFGRQAFVGLTGGFGTLTFGRQYSAIDAVVATADPFGSGGAGRNVSLVTASYVNGTKAYYNNRINNSVVYATPKLNGYSAEVGYGFGEVTGNNSASRYIGGAAGYASGPLYVRLAHQDINDATATGGARHTILGTTYDFSILKAHFEYVVNRYEASHAVTAKSRDMLLGVSVPVGNGRVLASYIRKDDRLAANQDATMAALGYQYDWSKRTTLYTSWGRISNKNGAFYTVNTAIDVGGGNKSFDVGIRHVF